MDDQAKATKDTYRDLAGKFGTHLVGQLDKFQPPSVLPDVRNDLTPVTEELLQANRNLVERSACSSRSRTRSWR